MATDQYQPEYHFYPKEGFMNDPNGLIYYEGEYHLFYQYLSLKHWGHAVSTDLVHWQDLPVAIKPDTLWEIWSGSVVVDWQNTSGFFPEGSGLVAIFTHQNPQQKSPLGPQIQSIAYSHDKGRTWTMYENNPVIPNSGVNDFRDPHVFWHAKSNAWVMVVTFNGDRVQIYRSPDLKKWTLASEFGVGQGDHNGYWECPNLFELSIDNSEETRWVFTISLGHWNKIFHQLPEMQYFIGSFDGYRFTNENTSETVLWSDYGKDHYAAISWNEMPAGDKRRVWIGWLHNWRYTNKVPQKGWEGMMTIPRTVELKRLAEGIRMVQRPVVELEQLRTSIYRSTEPLMIAKNQVIDLPVQGDALEIKATFHIKTSEIPGEFGLQIRKGKVDTTNEEQYTLVGYDTAAHAVFVDRTKSGNSSFDDQFVGRHAAKIMQKDDLLQLHIFVDRCSIEFFANHGEISITDLIFPDSKSQGLALYVKNVEVDLLSLEIYRLGENNTNKGENKLISPEIQT